VGCVPGTRGGYRLGREAGETTGEDRRGDTMAWMDALTKDNVGCMTVALAADRPVNFP
jgi:hypothetical protein